MFKPLCYLAIYSMLVCGTASAQAEKPVNPTAPTSAQAADTDASRNKKRLLVNAGEIKLGDGRIVPGERIGLVKLNATRKEVGAILGVPVETVKMDDESNYSTWRWEQLKERGQMDFFVIIFQKDRVVQVETNASAFALPGGLSMQSSEEEWNKFWRGKPESQIMMLSIVGSPFHLTWKQHGFALEVPWSSRKQIESPIRRVIVLPKNQLAKSTFGIWSYSLAPSVANATK